MNPGHFGYYWCFTWKFTMVTTSITEQRSSSSELSMFLNEIRRKSLFRWAHVARWGKNCKYQWVPPLVLEISDGTGNTQRVNGINPVFIAMGSSLLLHNDSACSSLRCEWMLIQLPLRSKVISSPVSYKCDVHVKSLAQWTCVTGTSDLPVEAPDRPTVHGFVYSLLRDLITSTAFSFE